MSRSRLPLRPLVVVVALAVAACGGNGEDAIDALVSDAPTAEDTTAEQDTTTTSERLTTTTTQAPTTTTTTTVPTTTATTAGGAPPAGGHVVVRIADGDTFDVRIDGRTEAVRIIGVNAPERGECLADQAGRWLRDRIDGRAVTLVSDQSDRDRFGRLLRYVEVDGADVGEGLVEAGLAVARRYPPDTARADRLDAAQTRAERAGAGMWAPDACGPAAGGSSALRITAIRFDADGNDNDNLNDEWVQISNQGSTAVPMTGWQLKDESASHRFGFPAAFSLGAGATVTVRTGCGSDTVTDLYWCNSGSAVWNNSGDTAFLLDPSGNVVDSRPGP